MLNVHEHHSLLICKWLLYLTVDHSPYTQWHEPKLGMCLQPDLADQLPALSINESTTSFVSILKNKELFHLEPSVFFLSKMQPIVAS